MQTTSPFSRRSSVNPEVVKLHQSPQRAAAEGDAGGGALPMARTVGPAAAPGLAAAVADLELADFQPESACAASVRSCGAETVDCLLEHAPAVGRFTGKLVVAAAIASALAVLVVGMGGGFKAGDDYASPAWMGAVAGAGAKAVWDGLSALCARC